jgi:hypothetical protein
LSVLIQTSSEQQQLDKELQGCLLACYEEILKEKRLCLARIKCVISSVLVRDFASPPVTLDTGDDDIDDPLTVQAEISP